MNDDALAAVVAAARLLLLARNTADSTLPAQVRWNIAGRMRIGDIAQVRLVTRARSRWAMSGRLRD